MRFSGAESEIVVVRADRMQSKAAASGIEDWRLPSDRDCMSDSDARRRSSDPLGAVSSIQRRSDPLENIRCIIVCMPSFLRGPAEFSGERVKAQVYFLGVARLCPHLPSDIVKYE